MFDDGCDEERYDQSCMTCAALVVEDWGVIEIGLAIFARDYDAVINRMLLPYTKPKDPETREAARRMIKARLRPVRVKSA